MFNDIYTTNVVNTLYDVEDVKKWTKSQFCDYIDAVPVDRTYNNILCGYLIHKSDPKKSLYQYSINRDTGFFITFNATSNLEKEYCKIFIKNDCDMLMDSVFLQLEKKFIHIKKYIYIFHHEYIHYIHNEIIISNYEKHDMYFIIQDLIIYHLNKSKRVVNQITFDSQNELFNYLINAEEFAPYRYIFFKSVL